MASQLGANFFIGKPYKEEELLERMHYYLQPGQASFTSRA
jgi:DNA-binding response OmpR family regulator